MGICWSEPPVKPVQQEQPTYVQYRYCKACGSMCNYNAELCSRCYQQKQLPSAPPMYAPPQTQPQPQQAYYAYPNQNQMYAYYPQYMVQQQQRQGQISTAGAVVGGFMLGAVMEDIMDPM